MLLAGGSFVYINEPMNPEHPPGGSPGVLEAPIRYRFQYITRDNEDLYLGAFRDTLALKYHLRAEVRTNRAPRDLLRMVKYATAFSLGRRRRKRPLLDDPFASFSAGWLADRLGCGVVFIVRHPAAIVASRKRLGHRIDFRNLLGQPLLLRDWLEPFIDQMEAITRRPDDIVAQGSLLWRLVYHVGTGLADKSSSVLVVKHEDLALQPEETYGRLFGSVGVPFNERARRAVRASTSGTGSHSAHDWSFSRHGISKSGYRRLDSRAATTAWRGVVTPEELPRIREITGPVADRYYEDTEWVLDP
jgi:hypothetical protein